MPKLQDQESEDDDFTVYGLLTGGSTQAVLNRSSHQASLERSGGMVGDEIVTMLLMNTENTFHGALGENEVVIAPIHQFLMWRGYYASKRKPVPPSSWKISKQYADYRLIAFPVHISNPLHFTLGIMVNLKWKPGAKYRKASSWTLLHLDSCPCNRNSQIYALGFGKYLLELDSNTEVKVIEVPVIKQALNSNDCGFYPAHFLDIILQDVDFYIQQCIEIADAKLSCDSMRVKELWKHEMASSLRPDALATFKFHSKLSAAVAKDKASNQWPT